MATMKRRVIYMSDDEWAALIAEAGRYDLTASAFIRLIAEKTARMPMPSNEAVRLDASPPDPREVVSFNRRPFTPVPKRGK